MCYDRGKFLVKNMKENLSPSLKSKISNWQSQNNQWINALDKFDIQQITKLSAEGFPAEFGKYFVEDEQNEMGMSLCEDFDDDYHEKILNAFNRLYSSPQREQFIEMLAPYLIYGQGQKSFSFRHHYFAYTKNYTYALNYLDNLLSSCGFLLSGARSWLVGAMYNESNEFFNDCTKLFDQKYRNHEKTYSTDLTRKFLSDGTFYNVNSWISHYQKIFPMMMEQKLNRFGASESDLMSGIFLDLIKFPIEQLEDGENVEKVKPIIDFLVKDYANLTGIDKLEYMMTNLYFEKQKEIEWSIENQDNLNQNFINQKVRGRSFRTLFLQSSLNKTKEELLKYINLSVSQNEPQECIDFFKAIELPIEYYEVLERYVSLNRSVSNNVDISKTNRGKI